MPEPVEINDQDALSRRVFKWHIRKNGNLKPSAFKPPEDESNELSVDLARLTTPDETLARSGRTDMGIATILAAVPRENGLAAENRPLPGHAAHSQIEGEFTLDRMTELAAGSQLTVDPPD